ncbi:PTS mannose transporter subunit IID [Halobacillus kuroshimensis]|uniref:PTS mannose transporter subunit IID n=1 Tax=Halobacillus kuroshimensis TaxID=302481 RepID=A0ABS3DZP4_9BACI|nr:phage holin [Halobacillus kuroshimensis]MBN8236823.1 PTS mannose transporter subunit IID [Halobacillus kuroshimensis]
MKEEIKEIATLIGGFLTEVMGFLATLNIKYAWLTEASISAFVTVVIAGGVLGVGIYSVWKNTYVSKKGKEQKRELLRKGLK